MAEEHDIVAVEGKLPNCKMKISQERQKTVYFLHFSKYCFALGIQITNLRWIESLKCRCVWRLSYYDIMKQGRAGPPKTGTAHALTFLVTYHRSGEACRHAPLGGSGGMPPRKIFEKMVQICAIWCILAVFFDRFCTDFFWTDFVSNSIRCPFGVFFVFLFFL